MSYFRELTPVPGSEENNHLYEWEGGFPRLFVTTNDPCVGVYPCDIETFDLISLVLPTPRHQESQGKIFDRNSNVKSFRGEFSSPTWIWGSYMRYSLYSFFGIVLSSTALVLVVCKIVE